MKMGACAGAGAEPQRGSVRAAVTTLTHTRPEQAAFGRHDGRPPLAPSLLSRLGLSTHPISRRAECLDFSGTVHCAPDERSIVRCKDKKFVQDDKCTKPKERCTLRDNQVGCF